MTEEFLVGLQADFPATLSTVFRTGDKLQVSCITGQLPGCSQYSLQRGDKLQVSSISCQLPGRSQYSLQNGG